MGDSNAADGTGPGAHVLVMTRAGCHLCDEALQVVLDTTGAVGAGWSTHDVDADPELRAEFGDLVPVVLVAPARPEGSAADELVRGAVEVAHFRVTAAALTAAIHRVRGA